MDRRTVKILQFASAGAGLALVLTAAGFWCAGCNGSQLAQNAPTSTNRSADLPRLEPLPEAASATQRTTDARARTGPLPLQTPIHAVWIARFHYRYPDDVRVIIRNCAAMGFNTVLWQVRGEGTVQYPSEIEPWSVDFNHRDPGFDPLALAIEEAHKFGLRIEAWVNVLPGWKGTDPPPQSGQLLNRHPEWFLTDAAGRRQPLGDFYIILNPTYPEVRAYIAGIVGEIAGRYDIDGVHLDYVRYAWDTTRNARNLYPRDTRTLALYKEATGKRPDDDPNAWDNWRAQQLTQLVVDIRAKVREQRPGASLTAAVKPNPNDALQGYFQSSVLWLRRGLLDAIYPMAYSTKLDRFTADIEAYRRAVPNGIIVPGIGAYLIKSEDPLRAQMNACLSWGGNLAIFSYDSLLPSHQDRTEKRPSPDEQRLRPLRRKVLAEFLSQ